MKRIGRFIDLESVLENKSCFLFGPRQTGKSSLIRARFGNDKLYNLLDTTVYQRLAARPQLIREELTDDDCLIVIDEIQKLPILLDEVHLLIEEHGIRFLLTGSSARSLKRKGVNMLGGRARSRSLHPFVRSELGDQFDLQKAMDVGLIPSIYFSDAPYEDLRAYTGDYLKEEIAAEAQVRNINAFGRFLEVAGACHGQMLNYSQVSNDAQVPVSTVREYFQILQDTFLGYELPAWKQTVQRKPIGTAKFYFFDGGLARSLQRREGLHLRSPEAGEAFESYLFHELRSYCDYHQIQDLHYWRSTSQFEVDFILNHRVAIEVKAKEHIGPRDLKGLKALQEEALLERYILVTMEPQASKRDGIELMPWQSFLDQLWSGKLT